MECSVFVIVCVCFFFVVESFVPVEGDLFGCGRTAVN